MNGEQQAVPQQPQYYQPFMYVPQDGQQQQGYPVFQLPPQQYAPVEPQQAAQQQAFYPQIPVQQPTYVFTEPNTTTEEDTFRRRCKRFNAYKIGTAITIASFVAYFIVTPSAFPWFLIIASLSAGAMAAKFIRENYSEDQPRFRKHAAWFGSINIAFVLLNLWAGGFPFSVVPVGIWGAVLAMHAESIYNKDPLKKGLLRHAIIYAAVGLIILVAVGHVPSLEHSSRFNRMRRPDMKNPRGPKQPGKAMWMNHGHGGPRPTRPAQPSGTTSPGSTYRPPRPTANPFMPTGAPSTGAPQRPEHQGGKHKGPGHHGKGTKRPQGTKRPVDDDEKDQEIRKEYARETARHDTQYRFIMRTVGFIFMLVWSVILLVHACKTKRAIKRRCLAARNARQVQPVELQEVNVVQPPVVFTQN